MSCRYTWWRITTKHDYTKPSWIITIITRCQHIICFNCRTCLRKLRLFVIQTWWRSMSCCNAQVVSLLKFWHLSDSYVMKIDNEGKISYCSNKLGKFVWNSNSSERISYLSVWISYSFLQSMQLFWSCSYLFETLSYLFKPLSYFVWTVKVFVWTSMYFSQTNKLCDGQRERSYNEYDIFFNELASTCT